MKKILFSMTLLVLIYSSTVIAEEPGSDNSWKAGINLSYNYYYHDFGSSGFSSDPWNDYKGEGFSAGIILEYLFSDNQIIDHFIGFGLAHKTIPASMIKEDCFCQNKAVYNGDTIIPRMRRTEKASFSSFSLGAYYKIRIFNILGLFAGAEAAYITSTYRYSEITAIDPAGAQFIGREEYIARGSDLKNDDRTIFWKGYLEDFNSFQFGLFLGLDTELDFDPIYIYPYVSYNMGASYIFKTDRWIVDHLSGGLKVMFVI